MVFLDSAGKLSRLGDAERVRRWVESIPAVVPSGALSRAAEGVSTTFYLPNDAVYLEGETYSNLLAL
jgi:hypothetical protein